MYNRPAYILHNVRVLGLFGCDAFIGLTLPERTGLHTHVPPFIYIDLNL